MICSEGLVDLGLDTPGLSEIHGEGFSHVNPLFRNFETNHRVSGYGISSPGRLYERILARRRGEMSAAELLAHLDPMALGFYATLVLEGASKSLAQGESIGTATTAGATIDLRSLVVETLGAAAAAQNPMA